MIRIGIDIGGTKINLGLLDENFQLLASRKLYVRDIENLPEALRANVNDLCEKHHIAKSDLISCGIGIPGTVSADGKHPLKVPNLSLLTENFAQEIETALALPVTLVQDSRAAAWGEYLCGAGQGVKTLVCVTLGTGIGTGIVLDGKIFAGGLGSAGEMGHLPVVPNGRPCGCGKQGCLEKYCAGGGLDWTARELLGETSTAPDLFRAANEGDPAAQTAIREAITLLGNGLVSIVNLLSPDRVLFSGGLSEQEEDYLTPVLAYVREHCYSSGQLPLLQKAALGENAPLIGAALCPLAY